MNARIFRDMDSIITISSAELALIVSSLKCSDVRKQPRIAESCLTKIIENGVADGPDVDDILYCSDDRLCRISHAISVWRWCEIFSIPSRYYYPRPKRKHSSVSGTPSLLPEDLADLLIKLERIGYSVDPLPLVTKLQPRVASRVFLTDAELTVLWYETTKHKTPCVSFGVKVTQINHPLRKEKFKTVTGYKAEVTWAQNKTPISLVVNAPKYRTRPAPRRTKCEVCGYEWHRGDPESSAAHRKEHARRLKYLSPKPNMRFNKWEQEGLIHVNTQSPRWLHSEIYLRALAFKREFRYDFVQWDPEGDPDPHAHGYLFIDSDSVATGACAFRWREYGNESCWALQWIWITSQYRRSGILTKRWKPLRRHHGDFVLEPPVSDAMVAFVTKMGDQSLLETPSRRIVD